MKNLTVSINQRDYLVSSGEGDQDRVQALATRLDKRVVELSEAVGQIGDARLLVIAGLVMLDELESERHLNGKNIDGSNQERYDQLKNYALDDIIDDEFSNDSSPDFEDGADMAALQELINANMELENRLRQATDEKQKLQAFIASATLSLQELNLARKSKQV